MRLQFALAGLLAIVVAAGCGYKPHPPNGALECTSHCPSGYFCGTDHRCWLVKDGGGADVSLAPEAGTDGAKVEADADSSLDLLGRADGEAGGDMSPGSDGAVDGEVGSIDVASDDVITGPDAQADVEVAAGFDGAAFEAGEAADTAVPDAPTPVPVCSPSTNTCSSSGEAVIACSDDGLTQSTIIDCADSDQVCVDAACVPVVCAAGKRFCSGAELRLCSAKGESSSLESTCPASQYCDTASLACKDRICAADQPICNNTVATTCNADGSGFLAGGTDCAIGGQRCSAGTCKALVCSPSASYCDANALRRCSSDGFTSTLTATCLPDQYCDVAGATCKTKVCTASQPACNSGVAATCNADGSGFLPGGTNCAATGQICSLGTCRSLLCTPNAKYCDGNAVRTCSSDGLASTLVTTCATGEFCDTTTATCKAQICTPNQPVCENNILTTCNASGSGTSGNRTNCAATPGQICSAGACRTQICTPNVSFCKANAVHLCSGDGLSSTATIPCSDVQFCDTASTTCKPQVCTPNQAQCNLNVVVTCNAEGSGNTGPGLDCTTTNQTCVAGACVSLVVDTVGPLTTLTDGNGTPPLTKLNLYSVSTARTLRKVEVYMKIDPATTLNWSVYETSTLPSSGSSTFTRVSSTTTSAAAGSTAGYQASDALSVPLKAGYYYAIGVSWGTATAAYWFVASAAYPIATSFGALVGASSLAGTDLATITWSPGTSYYPERLTTTP
jgi:hypothetical protein